MEKARKVNFEAEKKGKSLSPVPQRGSTPNSSLLNKSFVTPNSNQSFLSNAESPKSGNKKVLLAKTSKISKNLSVISKKNQSPVVLKNSDNNDIKKFEVIVEKIAKTKTEFCKDLEKQEKLENKALNNLYTNLKTQKKKLAENPKIQEIEETSKKKMDKILKVFKEEALKMDSKLKELRSENSKLKSIISNPQLSSCTNKEKSLGQIIYSMIINNKDDKFVDSLINLCITCKKNKNFEFIENFIPNWFNCLRVDSADYPLILSSLCRKIVEEQQKRLKTEEETGRIVEYEENIINTLELKLRLAEKNPKRASKDWTQKCSEYANIDKKTLIE